jgi:hypothetical protein
MAVLWSTTIFLSALLLFLVQPMMAKLILPMLGGTPAVWNTCMLFYQAALLGGYAYVHLMTSRLWPRSQVLMHLGLLTLPLVMLPIGSAKSGLVGTAAADCCDRTSVFSAVDDGSLTAKVVLIDGSSFRHRSLFSLRRQQCGQHGGPPRLSALD